HDKLPLGETLSGSPKGVCRFDSRNCQTLGVPRQSRGFTLIKLDKFVEKTLIPAYTKSDKRETNPAYGHVANQLQTARRQGNLERVKALQKELRKHPSKTQDDPGYRRLRYIRYADDFLFGFAGPFEESHQIKDKVASFLQTELKLPLSAEKTLITHAHTGRARFLGYEIGIMYSATKLDDRFRRSVN